MKGKFVKKLCAVSLSALMLTGAGVAEIGSFIGASLPVSAAATATPASSFLYEINDYCEITITGFKGDETEVVIPSKINGINVSEIGRSAFYKSYKVKSVTIPDSVTYIGEGAFSYCESLTSVTLPSSLYYVEDYTFSGCINLTNITLPKTVFSIGEHAFYYCKKLKSVSIPNSVTKIGSGAFYCCESLTGITIPNGITSIREQTFSDCKNLTNISIPDGVTTIEPGAFSNCSNLTITIPDSVTFISSTAFQYGRYLTIKGKKSSYAETYANENNIPFKETTFPLKNLSTVSASTLLLGKTVTVNAVAEEGNAPYTYAVWYQNPNNKKWYKAQDYSANATVTVKPKQTGAYVIRVNVKDASGKVKKKDFTVNVFAGLKNTSTVSADAIKLGKTVTVTASSTGGLGTKQYAVWYKNPNNKKWYKAQDYSANTTVTVKPKQTGAYIIRVNVKDERGKVVKKDYTVNVTK